MYIKFFGTSETIAICNIVKLCTISFLFDLFSLNESLEDFKRKARVCVEESLQEFDRESVVTSGKF